MSPADAIPTGAIRSRPDGDDTPPRGAPAPVDADAPTITTDVLVVGGGPAGCAAAHTLARAGHDVVVVEREHLPRPKACGDLLMPVTLAELGHLDVDAAGLPGAHRLHEVVLATADRRALHAWPDHPRHADHAVALRRDVLDARLVETATAAGAVVLTGHDATVPLVERGFIRGAAVTDPDGAPLVVRSRYLLVADGANSRFGRSIGTFRRRSWPFVSAIRGYWETPRHAESLVELHLDPTGRDGSPLTGAGWVVPMADGRANVGVGVWSTSREFGSASPGELLGRFVASLADDWGIDPEEPVDAPLGGRVPVGGSIGPTAGPAHLVVGDAAGAANPFTGAGIAEALTTGRLAGEVLAEALTSNDPTALQRYPSALEERVGTYFKVGRLFDRLAGRPTLSRAGGRLLTSRPAVADAVLRIGLGALRDDHRGTPERLYRLAALTSRIAPTS